MNVFRKRLGIFIARHVSVCIVHVIMRAFRFVCMYMYAVYIIEY